MRQFFEDFVAGFLGLINGLTASFGWLMRHRRPVRDYETTESIAEARIHIVMSRIQFRRWPDFSDRH